MSKTEAGTVHGEGERKALQRWKLGRELEAAVEMGQGLVAEVGMVQGSRGRVGNGAGD